MEKQSFILEQAEKCLNATIADADALSTNCIYVAGVFLACMSACGAMAIQFQSSPVLGASGIAGFIYLSVCSIHFVKSSLSARGLKLPGNLAENLLIELYSSMSVAELKECEARGYDARIRENAARNKETGNGLNTAIRRLLFFPLVFGASYLIASVVVIPSIESHQGAVEVEEAVEDQSF